MNKFVKYEDIHNGDNLEMKKLIKGTSTKNYL